MAELLAVCIALPLTAALAAWRVKEHSRARSLAAGALGVTLVLLLEVVRKVLVHGGGVGAGSFAANGLFGTNSGWLIADGLNAVPMALYAAIALVTTIVAPRRDMDRAFLVRLLVLTSSTLAAYAAANMLVFLFGWVAASLPFSIRARRRMPAFVLGAGTVLLLVAGVAGGAPWVFTFLVLAAILQEFIFPFHRATIGLFEGGPILLGALLVNSHLGAFLVARVAMPMFPGALPWLGGLALFTTIYTAVLGIAEREPRRLLALLIVSQSSALLAGLATASHEGVAGALAQWIVLSLSSTMLIAVYRSVEVRIDRPFGGSGFMGLGSRMPRLAVFFAISGLTMVGLPGTLGFAGEDLLIHGVLAGYSWWGAALPIAIALNAYHVFRLFARLFLGKDEVTHNTAADALPRERWALSVCLAFLVWGGLVPRQVVSSQASAVGALAQAAGSSTDHPSPNPRQ